MHRCCQYIKKRGLTMITMEELLAEQPFFKGLDKEYLELLAGCAKNVKFMAGDFIFREGEEANDFYIIRSGIVALETHAPGRGNITIQTLEDSDPLGWSWLFPPNRWHYDAQAMQLVRAVQLDGKCLREKCNDDPKLGYELTRRVAQIVVERMQNTRLQLLDLYSDGE
jgi:CRP-like cAMP-binding protein